MPGLNQSGPAGEGPMTGRGMGRCGSGKTAGDARLIDHQVSGRGGRCGRGYRRGVGAQMNTLTTKRSRRGWGAVDQVAVERYQSEINRLSDKIEKIEQSLEEITKKLETVPESFDTGISRVNNWIDI